MQRRERYGKAWGRVKNNTPPLQNLIRAGVEQKRGVPLWLDRLNGRVFVGLHGIATEKTGPPVTSAEDRLTTLSRPPVRRTRGNQTTSSPSTYGRTLSWT